MSYLFFTTKDFKQIIFKIGRLVGESADPSVKCEVL